MTEIRSGWPVPSVSAVLAATRAARTESGSLGRITISCAPQPAIASSSFPVDGRRPGPPSTTRAPASANRAARPGPAATAITVRPARTGVRLPPEASPAAAATCSAKWVTRIRCGRPIARPASIAAPTSSTWTWTFHSPSPPTTTTESPSSPSRARSGGISPSWVSRRYITSYDGPSLLRSPAPDGASCGTGIACWPSGWVTGTGRLPVRTVSAASRITQIPRPPASTTPARASTSSCSGVCPSASRAAAAAARSTSWVRAGGP